MKTNKIWEWKFAMPSMHWSRTNSFSNFSCMFLNPNNFSNLNSNWSFKFLGIRNLQEQVKKAFCLPKIVLTFHCLNKIFRSLEQFFLRVGQNNFGSKTPLMIDTKRKNFACLVFEMQIWLELQWKLEYPWTFLCQMWRNWDSFLI